MRGVAEDTYRREMEANNLAWVRYISALKRALKPGKKKTMAEKTILICDGCEQATTSRKPVFPFALISDVGPGPTTVMSADAHDWNCFGRVISRRRKAEREVTAAAKVDKPEKATKR